MIPRGTSFLSLSQLLQDMIEEKAKKHSKVHSKTLKNQTKPPYKLIFYTSKIFTANLVESPFCSFLEGLLPVQKIKNSKKNFPFNLLLKWILVLPERVACITSLFSPERALTTPACMHQFAGIRSPGVMSGHLLQAKSLIKIGFKIGLQLKPAFTAVPQHQLPNKIIKGVHFNVTISINVL